MKFKLEDKYIYLQWEAQPRPQTADQTENGGPNINGQGEETNIVCAKYKVRRRWMGRLVQIIVWHPKSSKNGIGSQKPNYHI